MGVDVRYLAIPADCGLIERARNDPESAEWLSHLGHWFSRQNRRAAAPGREHYAEYEDLKLWRWCCEFAGRVPDIYDRNWDSSRRYDVLHYLLSATRRGELPSETDVMIARAFDDTGEPIGDQVTGSQGIPIRYLSPSEVHDIAQFLADIDAESIRTHYDPVRMESADVYKFHAFGADEEWLRIVGYFNEFKALITNAAKRGDIVLVIWN